VGVMGRRAQRLGRAAPPRAEISIEIERLMLDGMGPLDGDLVGRAIERRLTKGFATSPVRSSPSILEVDLVRTQAHLRDADIPRPAATGRMIGDAVFRAVRDQLSRHR